MTSIFEGINTDNYDGGVILAVSNSYNKQYYFNDDFDKIPEQVQKELKILLVWHTEEVGGMIVVGFDSEGVLFIEPLAGEFDGYHDPIGAGLKIKQYRIQQKDLFDSLQQFYDRFF